MARPRAISIFVGGFPPHTTPLEFERIARYSLPIQDNAPINPIRKIWFPVVPGLRRAKGYAFIWVEPETHVQRYADRLRQVRLHGRWLRVNVGGVPPVDTPSTPETIAFFNLPPSVTEDMLLALVEPIAPVFSVHVLYDPDTTLPRGYGTEKLSPTQHGPRFHFLPTRAMAYMRLRDPNDTAEVITAFSGTVFHGYLIRVTHARFNERPPSHGAYTLDIPGIQDFVRIPPLESKALRLQRIARAETARSAVPNAIRWMPQVINWLDDAQDLLFTALVLSKPILRRLPARIIPGLGWLLLTNDLLNILVSLFAIPLTGRLPKRRAYSALALGAFSRSHRVRAVKAFMNATRWVGFGIQAAQASRNVTSYLLTEYTSEGEAAKAAGRKVPGYGLSLGPMMGLYSDTFWAVIKMKGLTGIDVRLPPPADPLGKALRFLAQSTQWPHMREMLSPEDHKLLTAAYGAAINIIDESGLKPGIEQDRFTQSPRFDIRVTNRASIEALNERFGVSDNVGIGRVGGGGNSIFLNEMPLRVFTPLPGREHYGYEYNYEMTRDEANRYDPDRWDKHARHMNEIFPPGDTRAWTSIVALEASKQTFGMLGEPDDEPHPNFTQEELAALHAVEFNILPPPNTPPDRILAWLSEASRLAFLAGRRAANPDDLSQAAVTTMGGWRPGTETEGPIALFEGGIEPGQTLPPGITPPGFEPPP